MHLYISVLQTPSHPVTSCCHSWFWTGPPQSVWGQSALTPHYRTKLLEIVSKGIQTTLSAFILVYLKHVLKDMEGFIFVFLPRRPPTVSVMISFVCIVLFKSVSPWDFPPNGFAILQITSSCIALLFRRCPLKCEIRWCPAGVYCNCRFWPFFTGKKPFFLSEMLYIMY